MNPTTNDGFLPEDYVPTALDEALADLADCIEERDEVAQMMDESVANYQHDVFDLKAKHLDDMERLSRLHATWERRIRDAQRRVAALQPPEALLAPIAGGGPFEPTEDDWADYREWADRVDRELPGAPEPPMWGYE